MADIFISYKQEEGEHARRLAAVLDALGFAVWWDTSLTSGDEFRNVIREMIDQCSAVVVLWSPLSVKSRFVVDEAGYAARQNKLLPAMLAPCELPFGFGQHHSDSLAGWTGQVNHPGFQRLLKAIEVRTRKHAQMGAGEVGASAAQKSEIAEFQMAARLRSVAAWEKFIKDYPSSSFRGFIEAQMEELSSSGAAQSPGAKGASGRRLHVGVSPMRAVLIAVGGIAVIGLGYGVSQGWIGGERAAGNKPVTALPAQSIDSSEAASGPMTKGASQVEAREPRTSRTNAASSADVAEAVKPVHAAPTPKRVTEQSRGSPSDTPPAEKVKATPSAPAPTPKTPDDIAWATAVEINTEAAYREYLVAFVAGAHRNQALKALNTVVTAREIATLPPFSIERIDPIVRTAIHNARETETEALKLAAAARAVLPRADAAAARARAGLQGTVVKSDGKVRVEAELKDGNGYGVMTFLTGLNAGSSWHGQWEGDEVTGVGVYVYADISPVARYLGSASMRKGVTEWRNGELDAGDIDNGRLGNLGVKRLADGRRLEGYWTNGRIATQGARWNSDGTVDYAGIWNSNKPDY